MPRCATVVPTWIEFNNSTEMVRFQMADMARGGDRDEAV
jgi:hypothetical protein